MANKYLYVVQAEKSGMLKLGQSTDPEGRTRQMQVGSPERLILLHKVRLEAYNQEVLLHRKFRPYRSHGEWYFPNQELLAFVEVMRADPKWWHGL